MGVFRFKQFAVTNERSAMKVNTDGVLLGASVGLSGSERRIMDAGTGTGTVALMLAQKCASKGLHPSIEAYDIDAVSVEEASANFAASPWSEMLSAQSVSFDESEGEYDLIVSNPPYFDNSLLNPDQRRMLSRHSGSLSCESLALFASQRLSPSGKLWMIFPEDKSDAVQRYARGAGLFPESILLIRTTQRKKPSRVIISFSRQRRESSIRTLTISENGAYTEEYRTLVKDFYLWA